EFAVAINRITDHRRLQTQRYSGIFRRLYRDGWYIRVSTAIMRQTWSIRFRPNNHLNGKGLGLVISHRGVGEGVLTAVVGIRHISDGAVRVDGGGAVCGGNRTVVAITDSGIGARRIGVGVESVGSVAPGGIFVHL